jgi:hypothetical protein
MKIGNRLSHILNRWKPTYVSVSVLGGVRMSDLSLIDADAAGRAHFYREKAEEIRRAARLANSLDAVKDLLETVIRFEYKAAHVEQSLLSR